jgi:phosphoglycerate dehydrogenase-like enzyme
MKDTAVLVNTARGSVIKQDDLVLALQQHKIAMAALDVASIEPISMDDTLLLLPNVILTPHIASASIATRLQMAQMSVDNLLAGLSSNPLPNIVNPQVYEK